MQWQWRPAVMMQWQWLVLAASLGAAAAGGATVAKTKPHLIFVMADDQVPPRSQCDGPRSLCSVY
jgi:hypothetical protein